MADPDKYEEAVEYLWLDAQKDGGIDVPPIYDVNNVTAFRLGYETAFYNIFQRINPPELEVEVIEVPYSVLEGDDE